MAVNVRAAETVSVVPFFDQSVFVLQTVIFQHGFDLIVRKAEILSEPAAGDGHDIKIVQSGKNTFLRHPQASGQYGEIQIFVCF